MSTQIQKSQQSRPPAQQEPKKFEVVVPQVPGIPPEIASQIVMGFRGQDGRTRAYVLEAGLELKLEQIAQKKGGIRLNVVIPISYSYEDPDEVFERFLKMPPQLQERFLQARDYDMAVFTTPRGTALFKGILLFGDGTKIWDYGVANAENVGMSTLHVHLDQLAATRARLRTIRKATARGFLTPDQVCSNDAALDEAAEACEEAMLEADLAAAREGLAGAGDTDLPFCVEDVPAPEPEGLEPERGGGQAEPVAEQAGAAQGPAGPRSQGADQPVAGGVRSQPGAGKPKVSKIQQAYIDAIREEAQKRNLSDHHLAIVVADALGRSVRLADLGTLTPMELAAIHQAVVALPASGGAGGAGL